ncbi:MAG: RNA 2',3'-cyclic phosphodiesterase [Desulfobacterales bacterium]|jgi:2'-5' RNA ligase|nr:RNA 2',3'-cyclic phosphodiesterase [Desulfobacterales bacterium]
MSGMLRTFVAVESPPALRSALQEVQSDLRRLGVRVRWVRPENIHLTLKFLGEIPAGHAASVGQALQAAVQGHAPFSLDVVGVGVFPGLRRPRVIWVGLADREGRLDRLQADVEERLSALGFPREPGRFRGHLTIGRFRAEGSPGPVAEAAARWSGRTIGPLEVHELVLFKSTLRPEGAEYTALARVGVGAGD